MAIRTRKLKIDSPSKPVSDQIRSSDLDRQQYLYLTTRGRKSGNPREIEIWFTHRDGRFYVIAEYETAHWLQNLRAHPEVQVRVASYKFHAHARVLSPQADADLHHAVQELSRKKYGWGDGIIVELEAIS